MKKLKSIVQSIFTLALLFATLPAADAAQSNFADRAKEALGALDAWVGDGENGQRWRDYLLSEQLAAQFPAGAAADPSVLDQVLAKYNSGADGLNLAPFTRVRSAVMEWRDEVRRAANDPLPDAIRAARDDFAPISPQRIDAARSRLVQNLDRLEAYLSRNGANGQAWKDYLQLDVLASQLDGTPEPDVAKLASVAPRFRSGHAGLELPVFANVADSLDDYIDALNVSRIENGKDQYARQIDILADDVKKYLANQDADAASGIGRRLEFVDIIGRSPQVVARIRERLARRNLFVGVGTSLLTANLKQPVPRQQRVTDYILGTSISGVATPYSSIQLQSIPCATHAHLRLVLTGVVHSNTVGANGPVCIYSTGKTPFCATKNVFLTDTTLTASPATASATTHTNINDIVPQRRFGSRLISKIAWKRAGQQQGQAEAIASRHAEVKIARQFDDQFETEGRPQLAQSRANFDEKLRDPLARFGEEFEQIAFSTTGSGLNVGLLLANRSQIAAPSAPPEIAPGHDLTARVHESFPNNIAKSAIGGYTLTDKWLREKVIELQGELPPELQDEDQEPWSITFDRRQPVTTTFADDGFVVIIRGQRYTSGERQFGSMNITARYKFDRRPEGIVVVRQGDLEILPPNFDPATGKLSAQQSALIEILVKRLAKLFKPEIPTEGIELPGELKSVGRLYPSEVSSEYGWLAIGWRRPVSVTTAAVSGADARR